MLVRACKLCVAAYDYRFINVQPSNHQGLEPVHSRVEEYIICAACNRVVKFLMRTARLNECLRLITRCLFVCSIVSVGLFVRVISKCLCFVSP